MKVLHVSPFFQEQYGGSERYCYNLCKELVKLGHDVEVFAARIKRNTPLVSKVDGISVRRFYTAKVVWNVNPITFMLHRLLGSDHDIVHVHSYLYFSSDQAVLAKILRSLIRRRTCLFLHIHGGVGSPSYLRSRPLVAVMKSAYDFFVGRSMVRAANQVLSADKASANAASRIFGLDPRAITVIPNGIDFSECSRQQNHNGQGSRTILFVGDLERWKGVETLVEAMRILQSQGNGFRLKLVGDGSQRRQLQAIAKGLDAQFIGQLPHGEVPKIMSKAFAVVLPSVWEGMPTVGLEAMATRTPFVGTDVGGIPEIVENNVTGLLFPRNNPHELANALLRLEDRQLRQELTRNAFRRVQKEFDMAEIARRTEKLYKIVLNR